MKNRINLKPVFHFILITTGVLTLSACHAPPPTASEKINLPILEQAIHTPKVLTDGSVQINNHLLVRHIGTEGVFILSPESRARFRMVKAGKKSGKWVTISSGLTGMEKILMGPYDSIFDGSPISVKKILED